MRELLLAVSHELRTPLSRLRFTVELLGQDIPKSQPRLAKIEAEVEALDGLVTELLDYVRLSSPNAQSSMTEFVVRDELSELWADYDDDFAAGELDASMVWQGGEVCI